MITNTYKNQSDVKDLPSLSEYNIENLYSVIKDDKYGYYYNILNTIKFPENIDEELFTYYIPTGKEGWTTISYKMYGTIKLWWIIASFNNISNVVEFPSAQIKLKIPKQIAIRHILDNIK